jgi:DNA-binding CsgD family transcriptional regulator
MSLRPQSKGSPKGDSQAPATGPRLTRRECEVMHWVIEGKRDREIATILGISRRTVEKHVCHILEKLGVETRTAAANECRNTEPDVRSIFAACDFLARESSAAFLRQRSAPPSDLG